MEFQEKTSSTAPADKSDSSFDKFFKSENVAAIKTSCAVGSASCAEKIHPHAEKGSLPY
jgi:hypothetical protein